MYDKKLVRILKNIAVLLEIKGENPFKSRAYSNAAEIIESEGLDIEKKVSEGSLAEVKGFGDALQKKLTEYIETGKITYYENLIAEIPETLAEVTSISSIGPKKAKLLWEKLGITNLEELESACNSGLIQNVKGFSSKTQEMILNSIHHKLAAKGKHLQEAGQIEAEIILEKISSLPNVDSVEFAGVMRRFDDTYDKIEIVAAGSRDEIVRLIKDKYTISEKDDNPEFNEFFSPNEIKYRIYHADRNNFGYDLHKRTGSPQYLAAINEHAEFKNINLGSMQFESEQALFDKLGMQFIPPELREDKWAVDAAIEGKLPDLIERTDLKGMLHVHSTWSDGVHSIRDMASSAQKLGFEYIAICDHSRSASYANGLDTERVKQQHEEIDKLNEEMDGISILKGIESDILPDGSLDYPDDVLESFELIVASVHSNFNMNRVDMTRRVSYALMSPFTDILGHPTGRLLTARPAYEIDIEAVIEVAADKKKTIEINCNPYRLDLSWRNVILARAAGVPIAINPDSHHKSTLSDVDIGIRVARKGRLSRTEVVNCLGLDDFRKFIGKKNF